MLSLEDETMNKRIIKAVKNGNEFKADWLRAQRYMRCTFYMAQEIAREVQTECIMNRCGKGRVWC